MSETPAPSPPAPNEPPVEIHRPARNWRGFLKEYAVIVIGVLTALAAQQAAEWWHWHSEVGEARIALTAEIGANNGIFARRLAIAPCIRKQIDEAEAILAGLETGKPLSGFTAYRQGSGSLLIDSEWESERASQTLTHFPRKELAMMSRYYAQLPDMRAWMRLESDGWAGLALLKSPPAGLGPSDFAKLRSTLDITKRYVFLLDINSRRLLRASEGLKIVHEPVDRARVEKFCTGNEEEYMGYLLNTPR